MQNRKVLSAYCKKKVEVGEGLEGIYMLLMPSSVELVQGFPTVVANLTA